uniref:Uncharacterized protein n=1 Tax=Strigamia maritima TaxID=126957 RepID=T1JKA3_STRMM
MSYNYPVGAAKSISRTFILTLVVGITCGFSFAYIYLNLGKWDGVNGVTLYKFGGSKASNHGQEHDPHSHSDIENAAGPESPVFFHDQNEAAHKESEIFVLVMLMCDILPRFVFVCTWLIMKKNFGLKFWSWEFIYYSRLRLRSLVASFDQRTKRRIKLKNSTFKISPLRLIFCHQRSVITLDSDN